MRLPTREKDEQTLASLCDLIQAQELLEFLRVGDLPTIYDRDHDRGLSNHIQMPERVIFEYETCEDAHPNSMATESD
jgi:hypothetical protein